MTTRDSRSPPRAQRAGSSPRKAPREPPADGGQWLYGTRAVTAALTNPRRGFRRLLVTADSARHLAEALDDGRAVRPVPPEEIVGPADLKRLLPQGAVHQGVAALVDPLPATTIDDVARTGTQRERAVVVVMDQAAGSHAVGAILRSAAAFGALAVVVPDRHGAEETGVLAKAASGALERTPLVRVPDVVHALEELKGAGFWTVGLAGESPFAMASQALAGRIALVIGAEGKGLEHLTREHCDYLVRLPATDAVDGLDLPTAAAVALYELVRT